jgi:hypothetical protein
MATDRPARDDSGENYEVEITDEMIEAGRSKLTGFVVSDLFDGFVNPSDVVEEIYRAMFLCRPQV